MRRLGGKSRSRPTSSSSRRRDLKVLGISGSLRRGSYNTALLRAAAAALPAGVRFEEWRGLESLPAYDEDADTEHPPSAVASFRRAIADADAILIATPEYNGSIPGALKNALDWASRPFPNNSLRGKPVAVIGASTGPFAAVWAQSDLRRVLKTTGADVLEDELSVPFAQHELTDGYLRRPERAGKLHCVVRALAARARAVQARRRADSRPGSGTRTGRHTRATHGRARHARSAS